MDDKKIKILIVDDDETVRSIYVEVFKQEGFEVSEAVDGLEGLDLASKRIPDIVFTGIIMPRMDGFALKDALAKNTITAKIPVVMLSHMGREEDRVKASELGIKDFIVQGMITPRQVVEKVKSIFGKGEYRLKVNTEELDAAVLAKDLHIDSEFLCPNCRKEMILILRITDFERRDVAARFICPDCEGKNRLA